jgi:mRNA interferase RelE/StbE
MNVRYKKQFLRDLNNLPEHIKKKIQTIVFERIPEAVTLQEMNGLKKLKSHEHYFRLRHSEFRIGISVKNDQVLFCRVLHRKDIYKYFP